jgi:lysyl-tRNA synthetase class 1
MKKEKPTHWADIYAEKIVREKGEKELYVCASGITPSGTIHIGNFREIISVELVVRALRDLGKQVRFIYSWDDYDVFRKVPSNMKNPEELEQYIRKPITSVPDPNEKEDSYARAHERELEELLPVVGIKPDYIYQASRYKNSDYAEGIKTALQKRDKIREILNSHRTQPLPDEWWPVSIFCTSCEKDTTQVHSYDEEWKLTYSCSSCGNKEEVDLRSTPAVKLPWRIDWPMRWSQEQVDFEPAGKDHHSEGGSFDTAREIVTGVFEDTSPVTFQYDFIRIKGGAGKISSSTGHVVGLRDVLQIYQPEIVRYLFAGTRPNTEFAISFDLDVLKIYEDYDKCERIYFGQEQVGEKRKAKEKRIYELSQVGSVPEQMSYQVPLRHLCNLLQIHGGDVDTVVDGLHDISPEQEEKVRVRAQCAWNWITTYAPDDFRFSLRDANAIPIEMNEEQQTALKLLYREIDEHFDEHDEVSLSKALFGIAEQSGLDSKQFFTTVYKALIDREKGPRLANFIMIVGKKKILEVLSPYKEDG